MRGENGGSKEQKEEREREVKKEGERDMNIQASQKS